MKRAFMSNSFGPSFACYIFLYVIVLVKIKKEWYRKMGDMLHSSHIKYN